MLLKRLKTKIFILPFLLLSILFIFAPLFKIVLESLRDSEGAFGLNNFIKVFKDEYLMLGIKNSMSISLMSSVIGLIVSFLSAYSIFKLEGKLKKSFINLLNATSNFQGIQLAFAFMILLGTSGVITLTLEKIGIPLNNFNLYSSKGLILIYIYFQIPLGTLLLYPSFDAIKKEYIEVAKLLDVSIRSFWFRIGIPILAPSILGTFSILFANSIAAYATAYALLGNNYPLLPIQISSMFTGDIVQRVDMGSALSIIIILILLGVTYISSKLKFERGGHLGEEE